MRDDGDADQGPDDADDRGSDEGWDDDDGGDDGRDEGDNGDDGDNGGGEGEGGWGPDRPGD